MGGGMGGGREWSPRSLGNGNGGVTDEGKGREVRIIISLRCPE